jgi:hypothetical protein
LSGYYVDVFAQGVFENAVMKDPEREFKKMRSLNIMQAVNTFTLLTTGRSGIARQFFFCCSVDLW